MGTSHRISSRPPGIPVKLKFSCESVGELGSYSCLYEVDKTLSQFSPVSLESLSSNSSKKDPYITCWKLMEESSGRDPESLPRKERQ